VAHEVGHIVLRHLISDGARADPAETGLDQLDERPYQQEVDADVFGSSVSVESMNEQNIDPRAAVVGIVVFLRALQLAEVVGAIVPGATHPDAALRLGITRAALAEGYPNQVGILSSWADQMDELLLRVGQAALDERETRRAAAAAHLDRIFRDYPATNRPERDLAADKAMLDGVLALLDTAPGAVLDAITANLLDTDGYVATARSADSPADLATDDRWRRHSIAHFLGRYLPPQVREGIGISALVFTSRDGGSDGEEEAAGLHG
jgi:hypothetical protein